MSNDITLGPGFRVPDGQASLSERLVFATVSRALRRATKGGVVLSLPSGQERAFSGQAGGPIADIDVRSAKLLWRSLLQGPIGFAESYISGEMETNNLADIFRFYLRNRDSLSASSRTAFRARIPDRIKHRFRRNTRRGSRKNIAYHYDLGNEFYRLWLDPGMTYSSAYFKNFDETLEVGQANKNARILELLELEDTSSLLEIGCGWGGLAEAAARAGVRDVTGLTISNEQYAYATQRLSDAGLAQQCHISLRDYRDEHGSYDRVASVEMIEAVGRENWPQYFQSLNERLRPGGVAVLQAITISEESFARYNKRPDFIQHYIFPGGVLPTGEIIRQQAASAGLEWVETERFGASYAKTLWDWRSRFQENWAQIEKLGFDGRFKRLWDYYLTYCAVGFEEGAVDVGFYKFRKRCV